jgi:hypothetical protein
MREIVLDTVMTGLDPDTFINPLVYTFGGEGYVHYDFGEGAGGLVVDRSTKDVKGNAV